MSSVKWLVFSTTLDGSRVMVIDFSVLLIRILIASLVEVCL